MPNAIKTTAATIAFVAAFVMALYSNAAAVDHDHVTACNFGLACVILFIVSGALFAIHKSASGAAGRWTLGLSD